MLVCLSGIDNVFDYIGANNEGWIRSTANMKSSTLAYGVIVRALVSSYNLAHVTFVCKGGWEFFNVLRYRDDWIVMKELF